MPIYNIWNINTTNENIEKVKKQKKLFQLDNFMFVPVNYVVYVSKLQLVQLLASCSMGFFFWLHSESFTELFNGLYSTLLYIKGKLVEVLQKIIHAVGIRCNSVPNSNAKLKPSSRFPYVKLNYLFPIESHNLMPVKAANLWRGKGIICQRQ